jgi:hypothetical protein
MPKPMPACPVCGHATRQPVFTQRLLDRHDVGYHLCTGCGLLQTDTPHWLDEAYSRAIADTDTGLLKRNLEHVRFLNLLLQTALNPDGRFVDVAGGYGVLTRLLRDRGFDAYRSDKYCANLFADGHEPFDGLQAEAVFAFEVLEHVVDPIAFIDEAFTRYGCRSMVLSTMTYGADVPAPGWWYYATETGQHISFYQTRTLAQVAQKLGCEYMRVHDGLHLMLARPVPAWQRRVLRSRRLRTWLEDWYWDRRQRPSLTWADHEAAKARLSGAASAER